MRTSIFRALGALTTSLLSLALVGCGSAPSPTPAVSDGPPPTAVPSQAIALPTGSPTAGPQAVTTRIRTLLGPDFNGTALVARDAEVLFSEGIGMADAANGVANEPATRFRLGSVSKQFTAMAILLLEEDGALSIYDRACDHVAECPAGWEAITIEHLIAHTSGIAEFTEQPGFDQSRPATPAETLGLVADVPLGFEPGRFFSYSNSGYVLLGMIIERVSGSSYEAFLEDRILTPLGMSDTGYDTGDDGVAVGYTTGFEAAAAIDMSIPFAAGALYSTTLDLLRWDEALYGDALLSPPARDRFFAPLIDSSDRFGMGYGFGLNVGTEDGHSLVAHDGGINGFHTYLARYPDDHIVIALLTNREVGPDLVDLASVAAGIARTTPVAAVRPTADAGSVGLTFPLEGPPTGSRIDAPMGASRNVGVVYGARLALGGATCDGTPDPAAGPGASSILAALQARPGWIVGAPTPLTLGAAHGWWFDVHRPDDLVCPDGGVNVPLFVSDLDPAADAPAVHIDPGYASRLFLLDDGRGGTIVIDINAHRSFGQQSLVGAAMPVLLASRFMP